MAATSASSGAEPARGARGRVGEVGAGLLMDKMIAAPTGRSQGPRGYTFPTSGEVRPHLGVASLEPVSADESPLAAHAASPVELQERLRAERAGAPFLVLRDGDGHQRLLRLDGDRL